MNTAAQVFDLAIIGSGFAGSLLAMIARRLGRSVVLLERGKHPRFAIGESSTPLANLLLEELATRYDLPRIAPFAKWGTWQRAHPEIACGLKRGFSFFHHTFAHRWRNDRRHRDQLLVAASPHDGVADTHWYRAGFDQFVVREAQEAGAEYFDECMLESVSRSGAHAQIEGRRRGRGFSVRARFLVDASGPRGFLHRAWKLPEIAFDHLPKTEALYSHFENVRAFAPTRYNANETPFPINDAAMHHVFDGGWIWVLRFNNGITSAGVVVTASLAAELDIAEGIPAWNRLLKRLPSVREQFDRAQPTRPFVYVPRVAFQSGAIIGSGWALLPSAAGFVDPLLSTGIPLTLLGIARLAEALERDWDSPRFDVVLERYATHTREELLATELLVAALYANMSDFEIFSALSLLYFAAASFSETARRLKRPELAGGFLLHNHPHFGPQLRALSLVALRGVAPSAKAQLIDDIRHALDPIDVAGLSDSKRRNWYPVEAADLISAAPKLGVTNDDIAALLARSGFLPAVQTAGTYPHTA